MVAHGHGTQQDLSSSDALAVAAAAVRHAPCEFDATLGLERGAAVAVNALDYAADPVAGRLVGLSLDETVIERVDERAGKVHVHFPRIGYQIKVEKTQ